MGAAAFVTGGTGFVGRALVERLVAEGRPVRALARTGQGAESLRRLGARPVPGDVLDPDSLLAGMDGCEVAYHVAGVNALCVSDPAPMFRVNVEGSLNLVRAAARVGLRRVVHTSSAATVGEPAGAVGREDTPHRGWFLTAYERSKYEAERAVLRAAEEHAVEVVVVNPASVQGPGRLSGTARILLAAAGGRLRVAVETRFAVVDVADCAEGHRGAERLGHPGERYLLSGPTLTTTEALDLLARVAGIRPRAVRLPRPAVVAGAAAVEFAARALRRPAPVCREAARALLHGHTYDGSRAERELGLRYTPVEETLRRTLAWCVESGNLPPLPRIPAPGE